MVRREPRHRIRAPFPLLGLLVTLVVGLLAAPVQAKVFLNPNGPAGKQYSAYLDRARQAGSGRQGSAGVPGSAAAAPLFGEGVTPASAKHGPAPASGASSGHQASSPPLGPSGGGGNTLLVVLLCLAVLIPGAAVVGARRLRGARSAH